MLWGVTTMTFYHRPILEAVEFIGSCGFDCVEIWADHAWDEKKGASAAKLKGALARWGLQSTVHCPVLDVNIASPNRGIREESLRQYRAALDLAKELGARLVVLHPVGNLPPGKLLRPTGPIKWKLWAESSHTQRNWGLWRQWRTWTATRRSIRSSSGHIWISSLQTAQVPSAGCAWIRPICRIPVQCSPLFTRQGRALPMYTSVMPPASICTCPWARAAWISPGLSLPCILPVIKASTPWSVLYPTTPPRNSEPNWLGLRSCSVKNTPWT